ncbi:metal ABC transporter solute-binding protein, Zn/Mn family [Sediminibacillus albus]|uniref:Zinc transport system substrate-binding protein n=1 Tax=Sediminibacillus albus TaxID=407036 RepID=A0A1G8YVX7_9BACI|nr:zinc ABC transporter substrate-binding protein [Sediminibacillus albus]SDK06916.1 zinc transport system substrate-binding protein [Sediminibacillus albus]
MKWKLFFIAILSSIFLGGCTNPGSQNDKAPLIQTTVYPIQFIIERLSEGSIDVKTIYPPGTDAHSYEPTAKAMTDIAESDAFIYLGEELETFASTSAEALSSEDVQLVELAEHEELFETNSLPDDHEHESHKNPDGHSHSDHDPHVWLDPLRMLEMADIIKGELSSLYPKQKKAFEQNFKALEKDLKRLDSQFSETLTSKDRKEILVSHPAYGYWEERYGIEQIAINGVNNTSEPSQKDLINIIERAESLEIRYVIFEQNVSDNVSKEIQTQIDGEALQVHNLAVLTEADINHGEDYFSLMKKNLQTLDKATD